MALSNELLTPAVEALVGQLLMPVVSTDTTPIDTYLDMLNNPVIAASVDLRIMLGLSMMEDFNHQDEEIESFVRANFANFEGNLWHRFAAMLQCLPLGRSVTEKSFRPEGDRWYLDKLQTLDPRRYYFEGRLGQITSVVYRGSFKEIKIPYSDVIHLVNQPYMQAWGDPYGYAALKRARPYSELIKQVQAAMALAGKRQATPILLGKTDTGASSILVDGAGQPLLDNAGRPIEVTQGASMRKMLLELGNSSVAVIDRMDEVLAIDQQTDGSFLFKLLYYLETSLYLCFLVPPTVTSLSQSGVGDSGLNEGHRETLRLVTRSQMQYFADAVLDGLCKPLIMDNFGPQNNYGKVPLRREESADTVALLDTIAKVLYQGGFSPTDLAVINRMRSLAGIEAIDELPEDPRVGEPMAEGTGEPGDRSFFLATDSGK